MEEIILSRLSAVTSQLQLLKDEALACMSGDLDIDKGEVISAKLETSINRFTTELHNYFRISQNPSADDISNFSTVQLAAEEVHAELKVKLKRRITINVGSLPDGNNMIISSRLPELGIMEFGGDLLEWTTFWDQFSSKIDKRNLTDVDKLMYLKGALKGDAYKTIEGLESTNKNYSIAVTILKERYGKENVAIDAHYSALYKVKPSDKSVSDCRRTLNEIERHLRVLNSLGENTNHNHLRFLILEKFPEDIIYEMRMKIKTDSIEEMREHLEVIVAAREDASRITQEKPSKENESYTVEALHIKSNKNYKMTKKLGKLHKRLIDRKPMEKYNKRDISAQRSSSTLHTGNQYTRKRFHQQRDNNLNTNEPDRKKIKLSCIFCNESHYNEDCEKVQTANERKNKISNRCFSCLREGHMVKNCKTKRTCYHCRNGVHNRALCFKRFPDSTNKLTTTTLHLNLKGTITILQTAVVKSMKYKSSSKYLNCRVLMDSGSQRSYVTQRVAKELDLIIEEEHLLSVFTFGSTVAQELESPIVKFYMETRTKSVIELFANVVPVISQGIPHHEIDNNDLKIILADDGSLPNQVDILIGNDLYYTLMSTEKVAISKNLFLVNSEFGWILSGQKDSQAIKNTGKLSALTYFAPLGGTNYLNQPDPPLDNDNIKALWDLEAIGITDSPKINRDEEAIKNFNDTTKIIDNRYTVSWPWTEYPPNLSTNFGLARGRLNSLLKRLDTDSLLAYNETLKDQMQRNIIEVVPPSFTKDEDHPVHYLPHHCVPQSGRAIRIVYDASAKPSKEAKSLNECLYCGPLMLEDLTKLLIRFRIHQVGISADVEKAFLQIALQTKDRDVTRFLWLKDVKKPATDDNLLHMRFCRVPFGIISSPFLLNATIKHHLMNSNKQEIKQITSDIYVDNLITGAQSNLKAISLYNSCKKTFQEISMNLRQWCSNSKFVKQNIPDACTDDIVKILGLEWHLEKDTLQLRFKDNTYEMTKRGVLKYIASIYDPCGFATPSILPAKIFLQQLWKSKIKWDTPLSEQNSDIWIEICKNMQIIKELSIPRCYSKSIISNEYNLHCFTDASMQAYAAVVYIVHGKNKSFVIGKSRLVPLKDQDNLKIPRLELLGVLIGCRLIKYVHEALKLKIKHQYLWTDSQVVISWCNSSKLLPPFIARRIEEIKCKKDLTIRFVPSELNPADVATRPITSKDNKYRWLDGPDFLLEDQNKWPTGLSATFSLLLGEGLPSDNKQIKEITMQTDISDKENQSQTINEQEQVLVHNSTIQEIKKLQADYFPQEIEGKETSISRNLGLFKDVDGILRSRGRLTNTDWSFDKRYPILIPKDSEFTNKIIMKTHKDNYHVGANHTLSIIRELYWIPQGKSQVLKLLRKCPICVKHGGGPFKLPQTPALPFERVNFSTPFTFTGIDYFGPMLVTTERGKEKRWVCLYTCLATRALHLEAVKDLTAEECLLALRRFSASRGIPKMITSDNAPQFKLTSELLSDQYCTQNSIKWKFIPQLAPWHGGFYERLVAIVKHCLRRTLDKNLLNDTQLLTVLKEVETIINTRPLIAIGIEPEHILKPIDFLSLGQCLELNSNIIESGTMTKIRLIEGWKRGQRVIEDFRRIFQDQYLPSLRERYSHSHKQPRVTSDRTPHLGDIVQIKDDSQKRLNWKVGKIIALITGRDGECRVARVKVGDKVFTRSIGHLYPLEIEDEVAPNHSTSIARPAHIHNDRLVHNSEPNKDQEVNEVNHIEEAEVNDPKMKISSEIEVDDDATQTELSQLENAERENNESTDLIEEYVNINPPEQIRPRRDAATRALEKIREWTRNLLTLL